MKNIYNSQNCSQFLTGRLQLIQMDMLSRNDWNLIISSVDDGRGVHDVRSVAGRLAESPLGVNGVGRTLRIQRHHPLNRHDQLQHRLLLLLFVRENCIG
jgi:hypothetical protein